MTLIHNPHCRIWSLFTRHPDGFCWFRAAWKNPRALGDDKTPLYEISLKTIWEPRDLWVGVYWTKSDYGKMLFYLCLIPCLPLRLHVKRIYGTGGVA